MRQGYLSMQDSERRMTSSAPAMHCWIVLLAGSSTIAGPGSLGKARVWRVPASIRGTRAGCHWHHSWDMIACFNTQLSLSSLCGAR